MKNRKYVLNMDSNGTEKEHEEILNLEKQTEENQQLFTNNETLTTTSTKAVSQEDQEQATGHVLVTQTNYDKNEPNNSSFSPQNNYKENNDSGLNSSTRSRKHPDAKDSNGMVSNGVATQELGEQNKGYNDEGMQKDSKTETRDMFVLSKDENYYDDQFENEIRLQKKKAIRNLLVISGAFLLLFTAYRSLENLQSSLNNEKGLGLASLGVIYGCVIVSSMFLPPLVIGRFGLKWTLVCSMICYVTYTASNYYPRWYTLIPASAILGLAGAPLWASKCAVVTTTGISYAILTDEHQDIVITRFFGIFFMIYQSCQVLGNLISSLVLQKPEQISNMTSEILKTCGASDCGYVSIEDVNTTAVVASQPDQTLVFTLVTVYVVSGILAILLVAFLLDEVKLKKPVTKHSTFKVLVATLRHMWNDRMQQLIIPLTVFSGLEQAFIIGEFTKSYVTCALGINWVGFVMISFGVSDSLFSFFLGKISKFTGRIPIFISGAVINFSAMVIMLLWKPSLEYRWLFFVLTLMWGYGDAVWNTQNNALYGVLFHKNQEAAFSNYRMWESLGFVLAFAYSRFLCVDVKLYILLAVLSVGISLYIVVEFRLRKLRARVEVEQD